MMFISLGLNPPLGVEGRWGIIFREMMASGDYLHPVLPARSRWWRSSRSLPPLRGSPSLGPWSDPEQARSGGSGV